MEKPKHKQKHAEFSLLPWSQHSIPLLYFKDQSTGPNIYMLLTSSFTDSPEIFILKLRSDQTWR